MRQEAKRWWNQTLEDLKTVKSLLKTHRFAAAAFYSQQAVEKALKSLIVERCRRTPPWVHNLLELARVFEECEGTSISEAMVTQLRELNHHYTVPRHPDAANGTPEEQYDERISTNAYKQAEKVIAWVKTQI